VAEAETQDLRGAGAGMKPIIIAGIVLVSIFSGCKQPENLQPFVAAAGAYALMDKSEAPEKPAAGCVDKCRCAGTGVEKSGDGLTTGPCRCPDDCDCKKKSIATSGTVCTTGTCPGWPPRNISR